MRYLNDEEREMLKLSEAQVSFRKYNHNASYAEKLIRIITRLERSLKILNEVQWEGASNSYGDACASCICCGELSGTNPKHDPDCELAALLGGR